jgi:hypothetical protein
VALLAENSNLSETEARETFNRWEQAFVEVRTQAEETTRRVSQQFADAVTLLAGAIFAAMLVGAFAAGAGGAVGTPDYDTEVAEVVESN